MAARLARTPVTERQVRASAKPQPSFADAKRDVDGDGAPASDARSSQKAGNSSGSGSIKRGRPLSFDPTHLSGEVSRAPSPQRLRTSEAHVDKARPAPEHRAKADALRLSAQQQRQPQRVLDVQESDEGAACGVAEAEIPLDIPAEWVEILHPAFRPQLPALAHKGGPAGPWRVVCICERQRTIPGLPLPWADTIVVIPEAMQVRGESPESVLRHRADSCTEVNFNEGWPEDPPSLRGTQICKDMVRSPKISQQLKEAYKCWDIENPKSLRRLLDAGVQGGVDIGGGVQDRTRTSLVSPPASARETSASSGLTSQPRAAAPASQSSAVAAAAKDEQALSAITVDVDSDKEDNADVQKQGVSSSLEPLKTERPAALKDTEVKDEKRDAQPISQVKDEKLDAQPKNQGRKRLRALKDSK